MKNNIKAEIISHSKRRNTGEEIITYKLTFPRIILSEVNTYKMMEKNTSSCLRGNTLILVYDGKNFKEVEIKDLFNNHKNLEIVSFDESYSFVLQKIGKVFHSGVKPVYRVSFNSGSHVDCTANHRFLKSNDLMNEYVTLKDFKIKQEEDGTFISPKIMSVYFVGIASSEKFYHKYKNLRVNVENKIFIATESISYSEIKYNEYEISEPIKITNIEYLGEMDTYDIEVDGKYHNFTANGIVVHNSRAIPFDKMVEVVEKEPFIPLAWQLSHKGMQGNEYITNPYVIEKKKGYWLDAMRKAVTSASDLVSSEIKGTHYEQNEDGSFKEKSVTLISNSTVTKQLANRLLEPFMWVVQLITGTRESFEHLFDQRCPIYELEVCPDSVVYARSKKEFIEHYGCFEDKDDLWWLQHNRGQAEIHFMDLAEKMYDALNESKPQIMEENDWHIPFSDRPEFTPEMSLKDKIMMSCAMTARVSYTTINDDEALTLEKAEKIYNKCVEQWHFSVISHCAKCMTDGEYSSWIKGLVKHVVSNDIKGYNKNLRGFVSLRQYIEDGIELKNV